MAANPSSTVRPVEVRRQILTHSFAHSLVRGRPHHFCAPSALCTCPKSFSRCHSGILWYIGYLYFHHVLLPLICYHFKPDSSPISQLTQCRRMAMSLLRAARILTPVLLFCSAPKVAMSTSIEACLLPSWNSEPCIATLQDQDTARASAETRSY